VLPRSATSAAHDLGGLLAALRSAAAILVSTTAAGRSSPVAGRAAHRATFPPRYRARHRSQPAKRSVGVRHHRGTAAAHRVAPLAPGVT
jgi:hypothetical protein